MKRIIELLCCPSEDPRAGLKEFVAWAVVNICTLGSVKESIGQIGMLETIHTQIQQPINEGVLVRLLKALTLLVGNGEYCCRCVTEFSREKQGTILQAGSCTISISVGRKCLCRSPQISSTSTCCYWL